ncbi:MAG: hypothetical protein CM15mP58_11910 [Burkholderiaceae bacterium]|nr:MAG: hypothetical protein CM15mP58_11910 [Burkholderiaceae bacterium]
MLSYSGRFIGSSYGDNRRRLIGPSLGADNIAQGFNSTLWGFVAIVIFIIAYYFVFGMVSALSLSLNITLLISLLSLLQATLTLPGIAAMALTLGMAIDSNVLINERIREEIRMGLLRLPPYPMVMKKRGPLF